MSSADVLVVGFGNPGRLDDGLGPLLAEEIRKLNLAGVDVDSDYQLNVEHAAEAAEHKFVIFADASVNGREPFSFARLAVKDDGSFTTHSVEPEAVMSLARDLFSAEVEGYMLGIRGYEFNEFGERLSAKAKNNLNKAVEFLKDAIEKRNFSELAFD